MAKTLLSPDDEFEAALQQYERAVTEYKIAQSRYADSVGPYQAALTFEKATSRICRIDTSMPVLVMSQQEVERRASQGVRIVDDLASQAVRESNRRMREL